MTEIELPEELIELCKENFPEMDESEAVTAALKDMLDLYDGFRRETPEWMIAQMKEKLGTDYEWPAIAALMRMAVDLHRLDEIFGTTDQLQ